MCVAYSKTPSKIGNFKQYKPRLPLPHALSPSPHIVTYLHAYVYLEHAMEHAPIGGSPSRMPSRASPMASPSPSDWLEARGPHENLAPGRFFALLRAHVFF